MEGVGSNSKKKEKKEMNGKKVGQDGLTRGRFIKMCQNTSQLCWGDEWPTLSPGWERVRVRGK
jgi:hypothetical protein